MTIEGLVKENKIRYDKLLANYDPLTGEGAPLERKPLVIEDHPLQTQFVPKEMFKNRLVGSLARVKSVERFITRDLRQNFSDEMMDRVVKDLAIVRNRYDFCYWSYTLVKIKPKLGGDIVPFKLNYPQLKMLAELEGMRLSGKPIRIILLKARQWGGSTLVQIYMAWIQICHKTAWYSTIIAQTKNTAARIMEMYSKLIANYPAWALDLEDDNELRLAQYGKAANDFIIKDKKGRTVRDSVIQIGSVVEPDNIRGGDSAMAHYSEVGVWKDTPGRRPEDLIKSVSGGILNIPYTLEVMESTAKGTGNYFHREWSRAKEGMSDKTPVFIPWYNILNDTTPVKNHEEFAKWLLYCKKIGENIPVGYLDSGRYYWWLWEQGATFEGINWYREKRKAYDNHADMASEAPSDDIEAFQHSGSLVFDPYDINELRKDCIDPAFVGDIYADVVSGRDCLKNIRIKEDLAGGKLKIWSMPEKDLDIARRYLVVVDIGGRRTKADYSVITVFDRFLMIMGGKPEVVAQWRGHIDHDLLAWKATQISAFYNNALLVIESNTLETKDQERDVDGDQSGYILDLIAEVYDNLYAREVTGDVINQPKVTKWGFHTNTATKPAIIGHMVSCVRDKSWVEREQEACNEMAFYEKNEKGVFAAIPGKKDDNVMTRAIGLWICFRVMEMPAYVTAGKYKRMERKIQSEATI